MISLVLESEHVGPDGAERCERSSQLQTISSDVLSKDTVQNQNQIILYEAVEQESAESLYFEISWFIISNNWRRLVRKKVTMLPMKTMQRVESWSKPWTDSGVVEVTEGSWHQGSRVCV